MKLTQTIGAAIFVVCGSSALAGEVVDLAPSQVAGGLSGITNVMMPELIGSEFYDYYEDFSIYSDGSGRGDSGSLLYEGTLMTRVVRSNLTGDLHFNYMIQDPNASLSGMVSHIEITGFAGLQTRVEYRSELTAPGDEGPIDASRSADGDMLSFDFGSILETAEESRFFFAMLDTDTFIDGIDGLDGAATATIYLHSGESTTFNVVGVVPTPGTLGLLSAAGLITVRRRR